MNTRQKIHGVGFDKPLLFNYIEKKVECCGFNPDY